MSYQILGPQSLNLQEVCESLLDNADMRIDLSSFPKVKLEIWIQGTVNEKFWKVVFDCAQVVHMEMSLDDDVSANNLFMVLEARVNETVKKEVTPDIQARMDGVQDDAPVWTVHLYGDMSLTMLTTIFHWQIIELSAKEYGADYA